MALRDALEAVLREYDSAKLTTLVGLEEGVIVRYDVATDFAVLCPNCHRMIHRMEDPSDLYKLRALLH